MHILILNVDYILSLFIFMILVGAKVVPAAISILLLNSRLLDGIGWRHIPGRPDWADHGFPAVLRIVGRT
jgi:hypothetical protein